jgi:hypothetical protein
MSEIIPIQISVYNKATFSKIIDTQFKELNTNPTTIQTVSINDFFNLYDDLFFNIPKEGDVNSHRYILNKELEYFNVRLADDNEVQTLLQEITDLRQQLLQAEMTNANTTVSTTITK